LRLISFLSKFSFFLSAVKQSYKLTATSQVKNNVSASTHHLFREQTSDKGKRERTRSALKDSAISVFASKGYEATKITDITSHAGLANGTFYNYYPDKYELLKDVANGLSIEITGRINEEMADISNAVTRVTLATASMLETARREPEWFDVLLGSMSVIPELQAQAFHYLKQDLELGIRQGHFDVEIDLLFINQFVSVVRVAFLLDRKVKEKTIRRTCESILRLLGLTPAKAARAVAAVRD